MTGIRVNDNGTVKTVTGLHVNDGGTVKPVLEGWVNDAGTIKKFWPDVGPPNAISNLAVSATTANSVTLTWSAAVANGSPVTGYEISYGTVASGGFATIKNVGVVTSDVIAGLASATNFQFRIRANSALGFAPYSNVVQGQTTAAVAPQAPSVRVTNRNSSSVTLEITAGAGGTPVTYNVQRAENLNAGSGLSFGAAGSPAFTASPQSFTSGSRPSATAYAWRVSATNASGTSAFSTVVYGNTTGNVANGSVTCGVDPEDVGAFKDTGWGSNSAASGNAGQAFGSIFPGALNGVTIARIARSGTSTMTIWLEAASVPSNLFTRILLGDGQYAFTANVSPATVPGGTSGTLWVTSWGDTPASVIGDWINGANVPVTFGN